MESNEIQSYYNQGREQDRLLRENGNLERVRTQELILRHLPKAPAIIIDIGGGAGVYALWLAGLGYRVHLVDLMPLHIEQAMKASENQPDHPLASAKTGDAQRLDFPDASADAVLMMGPLYHLPKRAARIQALREAYRVLKPSGMVFTATISRFASLMDGMMRGLLTDAHFAELVERDLVDGQHRNPSQQPGYFTTAYFHYPTEIQTEVTEAGFHGATTLAIEGPANFMPNFDTFWNDDVLRERLLSFIRTIESDPTIMGASAHLMTYGRKV